VFWGSVEPCRCRSLAESVWLPLGIAAIVLVRRRVVSGTGRRNTSPLTAAAVDEGGE